MSDEHAGLMAGYIAEIEQLTKEVERLRSALQDIVIGGNGDRNWTLDEVRAYAADALRDDEQKADNT